MIIAKSLVTFEHMQKIINAIQMGQQIEFRPRRGDADAGWEPYSGGLPNFREEEYRVAPTDKPQGTPQPEHASTPVGKRYVIPFHRLPLIFQVANASSDGWHTVIRASDTSLRLVGDGLTEKELRELSLLFKGNHSEDEMNTLARWWWRGDERGQAGRMSFVGGRLVTESRSQSMT